MVFQAAATKNGETERKEDGNVSLLSAMNSVVKRLCNVLPMSVNTQATEYLTEQVWWAASLA